MGELCSMKHFENRDLLDTANSRKFIFQKYKLSPGKSHGTFIYIYIYIYIRYILIYTYTYNAEHVAHG